MDVRMRTRRKGGRGKVGGVNEKIKGRYGSGKRGEYETREVEGSKESMKEHGGEDVMRRRERTRTRRAARYANIGFSVRTVGPSARKRLFGTLFLPYGWMTMDGERDSSLAERRPRTTFSVKFHENRPTNGGRTLWKLG